MKTSVLARLCVLVAFSALAPSLGFAFNCAREGYNDNTGWTVICPDNGEYLRGDASSSFNCLAHEMGISDVKAYCKNPTDELPHALLIGSRTWYFYACKTAWEPQSSTERTPSAVCSKDNSGSAGGSGGQPDQTTASQGMIDQCRQARDGLHCDAAGDGNIGQAVSAGKVLLNAAASNSTPNASGVCSQLKSVAGAATAAIGAFKLACQVSVQTCITSCTPASGVIPDSSMKDNLVFCEKMNNKVADALPTLVTDVTNMMNQQSAQCDNLKNQLNQGCAANPSAPGCPGYQAGNTGSNSNMNPNGSPVGMGGGLGADGSLNAGAVGPLADDGLGALLDDQNKLGDGKGGGAGGPGRGAGAPGSGLGGGGTAAAAAKRAAAAREARVAGNIYGGLLNSNNGGTNARPGGYGGDGKNGRAVFGSQYAVGQKVPNLSQFLPNRKYDPRRSIAGVTGPDGITGPDSNLFEKVKTQYIQQQTKGAFINQ